MTTDDDHLDPVDRAALERAVALTLAEEDQGRVRQVQDMLADGDRMWWETASFCSYHRQTDALRLLPHEATPSQIDIDEIDAIIARGPEAISTFNGMPVRGNKEYGAAVLLRKMLKAGLSQYDPTPLESLAAARRKAPA